MNKRSKRPSAGRFGGMTQNQPRTGGRNLKGPVAQNVQGQNAPLEGVYANSRLIHIATSLVGNVVQVQVKDGSIYEGVFRTMSPKMEVVLELAHKVEVGQTSLPSRDQLQEKLIFHQENVVMLTALDVDLDYATKGGVDERGSPLPGPADSFTDAAISKFNGQIAEKELQPWEADSDQAPDLLLDADGGTVSSNGWDAAEMFRTNEKRYGVQSSYDSSLAGYTTQLKEEDTKEYREKRDRAQRIADEIERSTDYQRRVALEVHDDEEAAFSAVHRPSRNDGGGDLHNRYVPPHMRKDTSRGRGQQMSPKPQRTGHHGPGGMGPRGSPRAGAGSPHTVGTHPHAVSPQNRRPGGVPPHASSQAPQHGPPPASSAKNDSNSIPPTVNGEASIPQPSPVAPGQPDGSKHPASEVVSRNVPRRDDLNKPALPPAQANAPHPSSTIYSNTERKNTTAKGLTPQLTSLKKFSEEFRLSEGTNKHDPKPKAEEIKDTKELSKDASLSKDKESSTTVKEERKESKATETVPMKEGDQKGDKSQDNPKQGEGISETVKKSQLNPNAKEFNPSAKPFVPAAAAISSAPRARNQTPTPPRPQTQSPVVMQQQGPMIVHGTPLFTSVPSYGIVSTGSTMTMTGHPTFVGPIYAQQQQKTIYAKKVLPHWEWAESHTGQTQALSAASENPVPTSVMAHQQRSDGHPPQTGPVTPLISPGPYQQQFVQYPQGIVGPGQTMMPQQAPGYPQQTMYPMVQGTARMVTPQQMQLQNAHPPQGYPTDQHSAPMFVHSAGTMQGGQQIYQQAAQVHHHAQPPPHLTQGHPNASQQHASPQPQSSVMQQQQQQSNHPTPSPVHQQGHGQGQGQAQQQHMPQQLVYHMPQQMIPAGNQAHSQSSQTLHHHSMGPGQQPQFAPHAAGAPVTHMTQAHGQHPHPQAQMVLVPQVRKAQMSGQGHSPTSAPHGAIAAIPASSAATAQMTPQYLTHAQGQQRTSHHQQPPMQAYQQGN
ncbi:ataxin-2-like protein isoform X4 [Branchiostoma floridae]|uniref:Ataxin-2-like protein isoform X4 n=1 Tax=Branchiostoma floridae TaxID=7739 RepID=A0A9J7N2C1_BRAFL|nr:ataxin-2-like protein isoform X4 [Branchiostoma floridae]